MEHLNALIANLKKEQERLANAKTDSEKELRSVWVKQLKKEIASEKSFLGIVDIEMTDDELLAELLA